MNKSQQALELIARFEITAKEAAQRVGISTAAVSKAKLHPSEKQQLNNAIAHQTFRCPRCNHEFPHHWTGCGSIRAMESVQWSP